MRSCIQQISYNPKSTNTFRISFCTWALFYSFFDTWFFSFLGFFIISLPPPSHRFSLLYPFVQFSSNMHGGSSNARVFHFFFIFIQLSAFSLFFSVYVNKLFSLSLKFLLMILLLFAVWFFALLLLLLSLFTLFHHFSYALRIVVKLTHTCLMQTHTFSFSLILLIFICMFPCLPTAFFLLLPALPLFRMLAICMECSCINTTPILYQILSPFSGLKNANI